MMEDTGMIILKTALSINHADDGDDGDGDDDHSDGDQNNHHQP